MKDKRYRIDREIYFVFVLVIGISVFNAIYSSLKIGRNQEETAKIIRQDIPSLQMLEKMNMLVTRAKMYTTNWVYLPGNYEGKNKLKTIHNNEYPELKHSLLRLMSDWENDAIIDTMKIVFNDFELLMVHQKDIMSKLVNFEDYLDPTKRFAAEEIIEDRLLPESSEILARLEYVINVKKTNSEVRHSEIAASSRFVMWSVLGIAIMIVFVVLLSAFFISKNIILPTMRLKNFILQMGKGEVPEEELRSGSNAIGEMTDAVMSLAQSLRQRASFAHSIGDGNLNVEFHALGDNDELGNALLQMRENLRKADDENQHRHWISGGLARINEVLRENTDDVKKLSDEIISAIVSYLNACNGGIFLCEKENGKTDRIELAGSCALVEGSISTKLGPEEGLVGQAIRDNRVICLSGIPDAGMKVQTGISEAFTTNLLIVPLRNHNQVYGAIVIGSFTPFTDSQVNLIETISDSIASTIVSVRVNTFTKNLLDETRKQAVRLTSKEEELRQINEELSNQSKLLQASEEELKQSNMELKRKARELEQKNEILEQAREAISIKAKELEQTNKYKSEFLANMSHELRTPLNSVMILAKLLTDNRSSNLTDKQIEYARVIHKSGADLLLLINDILDLSKIEAGKVELLPERVQFESLATDIRLMFSELAIEKKINFDVKVDESLPEKFVTDRIRLEQIIKNLLSNAFKFTPEDGSVTLFVRRANGKTFTNSKLNEQDEVLEFSVTDTGIGIPVEKQALIFEAFQQADGSTSRRYGGTGLGLSISKMLVSMLGGEMQLVSIPGKGSTFSIFIPMTFRTKQSGDGDQNKHHLPSKRPVTSGKPVTPALVDDRGVLTEGDKVLLIVEEDIPFAKFLMEMAHERNFKAVVAVQGNTGIALAEQYQPDAIIMDVNMPGSDGMAILNSFRENENLKNIPLHLISNTISSGAAASALLRKPVDIRDLDSAFTSIDDAVPTGTRHVLVIEDDRIQQEIVSGLIISQHRSARASVASSVSEAKTLIAETRFDCIVLDLDLGKGISEGIGLLRHIKRDLKHENVPVIVFTSAEINDETRSQLEGLPQAVLSKNPQMLDSLIGQTKNFLQDIEAKRKPAPGRRKSLPEGSIILLADDDMRNIYALKSVLEAHKVKVITASTGKEAVEKSALFKPDLIIMDIMMPEMDGFEAMKEIKKTEAGAKIPVVALTAKAMVGDREKCIQCGAAAYIAKPVDNDELISVLSVWLNKKLYD